MRKNLKEALTNRLMELGAKKIPPAVVNSVLEELEDKFQSMMIKRVTPRMVMRHYTSVCGFKMETRSRKKENEEDHTTEAEQPFPTNEAKEDTIQQN